MCFITHDPKIKKNIDVLIDIFFPIFWIILNKTKDNYSGCYHNKTKPLYLEVYFDLLKANEYITKTEKKNKRESPIYSCLNLSVA